MKAGGPNRRRLLQGAAAAAALPLGAVAPAQDPAAEKKVLRLLFGQAETSFDPARISDLYSRAVTSHIFEAPYVYDMLARPTRVRPLTAAAMPDVSEDFRVWTVRIQPGIYFADDPVFKGKRRELVAQDYVYAFQRVVDPANISPIEPLTIDLRIKGLAAVRDAALKGKSCASRWRNRGRASSTRWPCLICWAAWRARWWSSTLIRSASTRWAPGRFA
jgi:ABC-type transport system substrate-binding protein